MVRGTEEEEEGGGGGGRGGRRRRRRHRRAAAAESSRKVAPEPRKKKRERERERERRRGKRIETGHFAPRCSLNRRLFNEVLIRGRIIEHPDNCPRNGLVKDPPRAFSPVITVTYEGKLFRPPLRPSFSLEIENLCMDCF